MADRDNKNPRTIKTNFLASSNHAWNRLNADAQVTRYKHIIKSDCVYPTLVNKVKGKIMCIFSGPIGIKGFNEYMAGIGYNGTNPLK